MIVFLFGFFVIYQYYFQFNHIENFSGFLYLLSLIPIYAIYKYAKITDFKSKWEKYLSYSYLELLGVFLVHLFILGGFFFIYSDISFDLSIKFFFEILLFCILPFLFVFVSWAMWSKIISHIWYTHTQNNTFNNILSIILGFSLFVFLLVVFATLWFYNLISVWIVAWLFMIISYRQCLLLLSIFFHGKIITKQTSHINSFILSSEFFYYIITLLIGVSFISIFRPFPIGWDDLGAYMNFAQIFAEAWNIWMLGWMHTWQVFTGIWYMFHSPTQAFYLNSIGWILSVFFLWGIFQKYLSGKDSRQFINIPLMLSIIFLAMPMVVFQQAKDIKHDTGLFFLSIWVIYILFHILQNNILWDAKNKLWEYLEEKNINLSSNILIFIIIWFVLWFTFTIKVTSLLLILWVFWVLFFSYLSYIWLFWFLWVFVWLFTKLWLWDYMNIVYSTENQQAINVFSIICLVWWVFALSISFFKNSDKIKLFLWKILAVFIGIIIAIAPWWIQNLSSSDGFWVSQIISWEPQRAEVDYSTIYSQEELELKQQEQEKFSLSATGSTWNEDWGRYLGYQQWVNNWIWLPYNLSMQENQKGEFTDISYLYFALLPLVLLFLPVRRKSCIIPIAGIFIFEILLFFIPVTRELFQSFFGMFTFPVGYLILLIWFLIPFFILMLSLKESQRTTILKYNFVFSLIYIFLWTISAYGVVWYGIVMYFNLLLIIWFGLYYAMSFHVDDNQEIKQSKAIISLSFMGVILTYFIMSVVPHSISNLQSAGYKDFKIWNITSIEAPYLYNPDYLKILFHTNIHPDKHKDFIENALDSKVANYIELLNQQNKKTKSPWEYQKIDIYNIDQIEEVLRQMKNSKNLAEIHPEISKSLENIYTGISYPSEEFKNDKKIYRIWTFLKYYISENNSRLFEDSLVMKFDSYILAWNPNATVKNMKELGLEYFLVDLNAATIDKDPRRNLTKRFESLLYTFTSTDLELISSDSKCLMAARETYIKSSKSPQDYVEYLAMAGVNYDGYEDGEKISRTQKRIYCYNKVLNLIEENKVDNKNYPYLLPIKNYLLQNPNIVADMQLLTAYLQKELPFGYKAFFKIK